MILGLVLEGGASRANFSNGVMDVLMENGIRADYVIGASAGIANGVSYVTGQIGRSLTIGMEYVPTKRYSGIRYLLDPKSRSLYNIPYVFHDIPEHYLPFDFEAFEAYPGRVVAVVTSVETGKPMYVDVDRNDHRFRTLVASCALPILFRPEPVNGELCMDGGITDPIPALHALEDGCDKVIVVTTRERSYVKTPEKALETAAKLYKRYPAFAKALKTRTEAYNASREVLFDLEDQGKAFVIEPIDTCGFSRTEKNKAKIRAIYDQGVNIARERMPELLRWLAE